MNYNPDFTFSGNNTSESRDADQSLSGSQLFTSPNNWGVLVGSNITKSTSGDVVTINGDQIGTKASRCIHQFGITNYTFDGTEPSHSGYAIDSSTGDKTININPDLFTGGDEFVFCKNSSDSNQITFDAQAGNNINGSQTYVMKRDQELITLVRDGNSTWKIKSSTNDFGLVGGDNISIGTDTGREYTINYTGPTSGGGSSFGITEGAGITLGTTGDVVEIISDIEDYLQGLGSISTLASGDRFPILDASDSYNLKYAQSNFLVPYLQPTLDSTYQRISDEWGIKAGNYLSTGTSGKVVTIEGTSVFNDSEFVIQDTGDPTKKVRVQANGIASGQLRTLTIKDVSYVVADDAEVGTKADNFGLVSGDNITIGTSGRDFTVSYTGPTSGGGSGTPLGIDVSNYITKSTSGDVVTIDGSQIGTKADFTQLQSYVGTNATLISNLETEIINQLDTISSQIGLPTNYHDVKIEYVSASQIKILAGSRVRSSDDTTDIIVDSDITVDITTSGAGGLDTGSEASDTTYFLYLIWDSTNSVDSAVLSTVDESVSGSITLPSGYTKKRQILTTGNSEVLNIYNNSSSDIDYVGGTEIFLTGGNGHGSTNTKIRRFTTEVKNIGSAVTYDDSVIDGASFTINEPGKYIITYVDRETSGVPTVGLSLNSTQLTTNINVIISTDRLISRELYYGASLTVSRQFKSGDIIRAHTQGGALATTAYQVFFRITKVGN